MPELPEVETVRRGLIPVMEGDVIARALLRRTDFRRPAPPDLAERLAGRRVLSITRRAKYLIFTLSDATALLLHLGMSGRILVAGGAAGAFHHQAGSAQRHDHLTLEMENGATVTFNDARRFGSLDHAPVAALDSHPLLRGLGPEPLEAGFTARVLGRALAGKVGPVKPALLDQRILAGLGNIYVAEALWRAGIDPRAPAGSVTALPALVRAIRAVLQEAIAAGGSSLRDHRQTNGELGYFQHRFAVYDREDAPCLRRGCTGTVARITQGGRSSFFCPACQGGPAAATRVKSPRGRG